MDYTDANAFIKKHKILKFAESLTTSPIYDIEFKFVGLSSKNIDIRNLMQDNGEDNVKALDDLGILGSQDLKPFMGVKLGNKYIFEDMVYYHLNSPNQFL